MVRASQAARWTLVAALGAAGCGRINFDPLLAAPIDAPVDAPQLLETLTILATGEVTTSVTVLAAGVSYRLVARGTCFISGTPPTLDADWAFNDSETLITDLGDNGFTDVGLGIDDGVIDNDKSPKWGPYRSDHIYTIMMTGTGAAITAQVHDGAFGNNSGSLTLEIFR